MDTPALCEATSVIIPAMNEGPSVGPLVSAAHRERVMGYVRAGCDAGARLLTGGDAPTDANLARGQYVRPAVFVDVRPDMTIAREEIFGPVLAAMTFRDESEAIAIGNATIYGLAAAVWSRDIKKALRAARALKAGTVWINAYNLYDPGLPFGGYKQSGFGRERGHYALEEYTQVKSVWVDLT